ncbi:hypothetical protein [Candidatus Entotheonella palauensis]|uniref:hypothetical protein n=1 Tax=Candidatus Entotheonella palauensis TaxID=93172 RepID=UPI000B7E79F8|nr:hypothetical protein [Candidatus Entotheonella palauensis]
MYELRRTYVTQPGKERLVASILQKMGNMLVEAGLRAPFHVSFNGGTCPGEKQRVIMTWTAETLESPMRAGLTYPPGYADMQKKRAPHVIDTWLEIHELMHDDKMIDE